VLDPFLRPFLSFFFPFATCYVTRRFLPIFPFPFPSPLSGHHGVSPFFYFRISSLFPLRLLFLYCVWPAPKSLSILPPESGFCYSCLPKMSLSSFSALSLFFPWRQLLLLWATIYTNQYMTPPYLVHVVLDLPFLQRPSLFLFCDVGCCRQ